MRIILEAIEVTLVLVKRVGEIVRSVDVETRACRPWPHDLDLVPVAAAPRGVVDSRRDESGASGEWGRQH